MKSKFDLSLYLLTDRKTLGDRDLFQAVEEAILGGVSLVQVREKDISSRDFYELAAKLKELTHKYEVPLIINDRLDIALAIDADGLHIGQDDLPASLARKILGEDKILGISASNLKEAQSAEKDGADYLGIGAIFNSPSKDDAQQVSLEELATIKKEIDLPMVAIGGITLENIKELKASKIDGLAVISAILAQDDIRKASQELKKEFLR